MQTVLKSKTFVRYFLDAGVFEKLVDKLQLDSNKDHLQLKKSSSELQFLLFW